MEWVETTGRTVEEAKDAALDQLGVDEQDAEFEVLEEAKSGLFGRLRTEARVRARVRPTTPPPKLDRRDRRRRGKADDDGAPVTESAVAAEPAVPAPTAPAAARAPRRRGTPAQPVDGGTMTDEPVDLPATAAAVTTFLEGLLEAFDLEGDVVVEEVDTGVLEAKVTGSELGLLIGPKGQTIDAVQELVRSAVAHDGGTRLRVDVGGYRERRREALSRFATDVAEQVRTSGEAVSLEPMSASDRKVVHDTVNDLDGVHTTSEGEDPHRRVVVHPV